MSQDELKDDVSEIYNLIRRVFHSQSGYFLSKAESYEVMMKVKEVLNKREK